jgi:hypothetical protein
MSAPPHSHSNAFQVLAAADGEMSLEQRQKQYGAAGTD